MSKLLEVKSLTVKYDHETIAIKNLSLDLSYKEIVAIVGESGCGKSTLVKSIINLLPESAKVSSGKIIFKNNDLSTFNKKQWQKLRGIEMAMIFQNPSSYINPITKIGKQFIESIQVHQDMSKADALKKARETLDKMNFNDSKRVLDSYPFQLSGGMKQRVAIAMALCMEPSLILADEATSSLDTVSQLQIMNEFKEHKDRFHSSILWVTHNIGSAAYLADRILVMNRGEIVEFDSKENILFNSKKDYTRKLIQSIPELRG